MTIGWDQFEGEYPIVYYGTKDVGQNWKRYSYSKKPTRTVDHLGMNAHFCELDDLQPNSAYYFVIKDSEGVTERYWFKTAPDKPAPFTCIMGGDTKCEDEPLIASRFTNQMVPKLRPHTKRKSERIHQYQQWAYLFHEYGLDIFLDADSHMSKITYPVKPDSLNGCRFSRPLMMNKPVLI